MSADRDKVVVRPFRSGDEQAFFEVYRRAFNRELSPRFFEWRFLKNPLGPSWVELGWVGDRLAGNYASSACRLCIDGKVVPAGLSMITMTDPDFRGYGLFAMLGESLYERMKADGAVTSFGFPNKNIHSSRRRFLGWLDVYEVPILQLDLAAWRRRGEVSKAATRVEAFDHRFDAIWEKALGQTRIAVHRDVPYLNWRYRDNPINKYETTVLSGEGGLEAYCISKTYGGKGLDIVEFVALSDTAAKDLLTAVLDRAQGQGLATAMTWMPVYSPYRPILEGQGFEVGGPVTYLGGRQLADPGLDLFDHRHWHFAMGDSDVY